MMADSAGSRGEGVAEDVPRGFGVGKVKPRRVGCAGYGMTDKRTGNGNSGGLGVSTSYPSQVRDGWGTRAVEVSGRRTAVFEHVCVICVSLVENYIGVLDALAC